MKRTWINRALAALCIVLSIAPPLHRPLIALATWLAAAAGRAFRQGTGGAQ